MLLPCQMYSVLEEYSYQINVFLWHLFIRWGCTSTLFIYSWKCKGWWKGEWDQNGIKLKNTLVQLNYGVLRNNEKGCSIFVCPGVKSPLRPLNNSPSELPYFC